MHPSAEKVSSVLRACGATGAIRELPEPAPTAAAAALRRADPEFVLASTGQRIGGVAPVGHPQPIRSLVDTWLENFDVVWAAGGHVHTVFPTSFTELVRITGGTPADVS